MLVVPSDADRQRISKTKEHEQQILAFVRDHPGASQNQVCRVIEGRAESKLKLLDRLLESGYLRTETKGQKRQFFVVEAADFEVMDQPS